MLYVLNILLSIILGGVFLLWSYSDLMEITHSKQSYNALSVYNEGMLIFLSLCLFSTGFIPYFSLSAWNICIVWILLLITFMISFSWMKKIVEDKYPWAKQRILHAVLALLVFILPATSYIFIVI